MKKNKFSLLLICLSLMAVFAFACSSKYFKEQPKAQTITAGDANKKVATFSVKLSKADEKAKYTWKVCDQEKGTYGAIVDVAGEYTVTGADTNTLTVTADDAATTKTVYVKCTVTDSKNKDNESKAAKLTINAKDASGAKQKSANRYFDQSYNNGDVANNASGLYNSSANTMDNRSLYQSNNDQNTSTSGNKNANATSLQNAKITTRTIKPRA